MALRDRILIELNKRLEELAAKTPESLHDKKNALAKLKESVNIADTTYKMDYCLNLVGTAIPSYEKTINELERRLITTEMVIAKLDERLMLSSIPSTLAERIALLEQLKAPLLLNNQEINVLEFINKNQRSKNKNVASIVQLYSTIIVKLESTIASNQQDNASAEQATALQNQLTPMLLQLMTVHTAVLTELNNRMDTLPIPTNLPQRRHVLEQLKRPVNVNGQEIDVLDIIKNGPKNSPILQQYSTMVSQLTKQIEKVDVLLELNTRMSRLDPVPSTLEERRNALTQLKAPVIINGKEIDVLAFMKHHQKTPIIQAYAKMVSQLQKIVNTTEVVSTITTVSAPVAPVINPVTTIPAPAAIVVNTVNATPAPVTTTSNNNGHQETPVEITDAIRLEVRLELLERCGWIEKELFGTYNTPFNTQQLQSLKDSLNAPVILKNGAEVGIFHARNHNALPENYSSLFSQLDVLHQEQQAREKIETVPQYRKALARIDTFREQIEVEAHGNVKANNAATAVIDEFKALAMNYMQLLQNGEPKDQADEHLRNESNRILDAKKSDLQKDLLWNSISGFFKNIINLLTQAITYPFTNKYQCGLFKSELLQKAEGFAQDMQDTLGDEEEAVANNQI